MVVAAGSGSRFGGAKQYALLAGRPVLAWSLDAARRACDGVVLVLPPSDVDTAIWAADAIVAGGSSRSESVRAGLDAVPSNVAVVAVHDAARPLAHEAVWRAGIEAVMAGADGAIPTVPVTDTIKTVGDDGRLTTLDRSRLVAVQTPQVFRVASLREAHAGMAEATDDAALVEANGGQVVTVTGSSDNLKITAPSDLVVAAALLAERTRPQPAPSQPAPSQPASSQPADRVSS